MIDEQALIDAIATRHSVRTFLDKPIEPDAVDALQDEIAAANRESGLRFQLMKDEPRAFDYFVARYGRFKNVSNYIACVGMKASDFHEKVGYWGERLVLVAQALGLNSCWVALSFRRKNCPIDLISGEKIACTIALGYGLTQGNSHKVKAAEEVSKATLPAPDWFNAGVRGALLAPTAVNQQRFMLTLEGDKVRAEATGGPYCNIDLGIVKRNFEVASGRDHSVWVA